MAIRKYIVKMNHVEALIKIVNDAEPSDTVTIDLDVDLLKDNEYIEVGKTPKVTISALEWSTHTTTGLTTITRNAKVIQRLYATGGLTNAYGADHEELTSDIVVAMTGGTLYLRLLKLDAYRPDFQPEQHGGE